MAPLLILSFASATLAACCASLIGLGFWVVLLVYFGFGHLGLGVGVLVVWLRDVQIEPNLVDQAPQFA